MSWLSIKIKRQECHLHPSQKLLRKNTRITRKVISAHFWGQLGGNKNRLQKDLKLLAWLSYPNSLMELCVRLVVFVYRNIANFGNFWSNVCLIHSSYWFYDHSFVWNYGNQICFLCETLKYGEKFITFNIGILTTFGNFWASICLFHSTRWLSSCIFAWNHGGQIFPLG